MVDQSAGAPGRSNRMPIAGEVFLPRDDDPACDMAKILSTGLQADAESRLSGRPVGAVLDQVRVGTGGESVR
jgi:hypothetical protein